MTSSIRVLMVASEVEPYAKTGGLADVIGSLPQALRARGLDVRVLLPRYASIDAGKFPMRSLGRTSIEFDGSPVSAEFLAVENPRGDVPTYLLEAPRYFRRAKYYGDGDDILRFGFFSRAALELPSLLGWTPDVIHCHDWHTGLLPVYLERLVENGAHPDLASTHTVFSIHNLAYQGLAHKDYLPRLGLDWSLFNMHELEYFDKINPLKAGLVWSDALSTVSPRYAHEIQTPQFGEGLDSVLRTRHADLYGIINGLDYQAWNPRTDKIIAQNFDEKKLNGKAACKRDLLESLHLPGDASTPVIGMVSRLSSQKGFDLIAEGMEAMLALGCNFVLLGSGDEHYMRLFERLGKRFPKQTSMNLGAFNDELAHRIYAGSDMFLMPSLYEPCGLGQMIALSYGTVPVVRKTGGLADTVFEFNAQNGQGNGFLFDSFDSRSMLRAIEHAVTLFKTPQWSQLVQNALQCEYSWRISAQDYEDMYRRIEENE